MDRWNWAGKDVKDMEITATKDSVFASRSVRRTQPAWRKEEVLALTGSPWLSKGPKVMIREEPPTVEDRRPQVEDDAASDQESSKHDIYHQ